MAVKLICTIKMLFIRPSVKLRVSMLSQSLGKFSTFLRVMITLECLRSRRCGNNKGRLCLLKRASSNRSNMKAQKRQSIWMSETYKRWPHSLRRKTHIATWWAWSTNPRKSYRKENWRLQVWQMCWDRGKLGSSRAPFLAMWKKLALAEEWIKARLERMMLWFWSLKRWTLRALVLIWLLTQSLHKRSYIQPLKVC